MSIKQQKDIVAELKTVQKLRDILDVVEIVMGFLSSGGASAEKRLKDYVKVALRMEHRFVCKKVCCLCT